MALIVGFNYLYTFLQLEPKELSEQLKRQGASIPAVRPGRATAEYITKTLTRMSVLGEYAGSACTAALPWTAALCPCLPAFGRALRRSRVHLALLGVLAAACHAQLPYPPPSLPP